MSLGSESYEKEKAFCLADDGRAKPNVVTWVGNLASANCGDDFYAHLDLFKTVRDHREMGFRITPQTRSASGPFEAALSLWQAWRIGKNLAEQGLDNILYVNASPSNILAVQPIWGTEANQWSLEEDLAVVASP